MTQEDKQLLLQDLCARLPYGVKVMVEGWDSDKDCDFDTVETLIGIDDNFIYTVWDKTGDREKHYLSVSNWKPYLRPMSDMTEEEEIEYDATFATIKLADGHYDSTMTYKSFDYLNKKHFDYRGLIEKGLAIEVTKENNPYKD